MNPRDKRLLQVPTPLAAGQMLRTRTTFIPRRGPHALVAGGVFALTRTPRSVWAMRWSWRGCC